MHGYYQGVGATGGLAGLGLPLSKCLVHRDSESDGRVPRWRIVSADRDLVMGYVGTPLQGLNFRGPCLQLCGRWEFVNIRLWRT